MARRFASVGYYVMLPNLYYRSGVMELAEIKPPLAADALWPKMRDLMGSISIPLIMDDTDALIAFADKDPAASPGPIGTVGYCMSGQYAINAAARYPDRVTAAASIYGVQLMTDQSDSPHLAAAKGNAEIYIACAEIDHWAPVEMIEPLTQALKSSGVDAEVEFYPKVEHGFAFPARAAYNKAAAEQHWERLFALFRRRLG